MFAEEKTRGGFISSLFKIRNCRLSGGFADAEIDGNKLRPFKPDHPEHVFTFGHGEPRENTDRTIFCQKKDLLY